MPNYRRAFAPGGSFFLTIVTHRRARLFTDPANVALLRQALTRTMTEQPFIVDAAVVMPDHLHMIWTLPAGSAGLASRVGRLKILFTRSLPDAMQEQVEHSRSRSAHRESAVWQRRFWEHLIRDERDFENHVAYIHYNPVKHGLVGCPHQWEHSSFHRWVRRGTLDPTWCCSCVGRVTPPPEIHGQEAKYGE